MNYRLQFSPIFGTSQSQMDLPLCERLQIPIANLERADFRRLWLIYDSALESRHNSGPNWNMITGFTLAVAVSIGCWVGIGYAVASIWK